MAKRKLLLLSTIEELLCAAMEIEFDYDIFRKHL